MPTFVTGQVELDHLVKVLSASFLLGRGSIILFIISTCLLGSYFEVVQVSHFSSYFCPEFLVSFNDPANEDYYAFAGLRMISSSITPSRLIEKFFLSSYLFIHSLTLFFFHLYQCGLLGIYSVLCFSPITIIICFVAPLNLLSFSSTFLCP